MTTETYNSEVANEDLRTLMAELGLSLHARPISPHEVFQTEVLPVVRRLARGVTDRLERNYAMENHSLRERVADLEWELSSFRNAWAALTKLAATQSQTKAGGSDG